MSLCVVQFLTEYIKRTKDLRTGSKLFIAYRKPYQNVTKSTILRWICIQLSQSGIKINMFSTHSTRSPSTLKVAISDPISVVLKSTV